jgi:hypothetical protein
MTQTRCQRNRGKIPAASALRLLAVPSSLRFPAAAQRERSASEEARAL